MQRLGRLCALQCSVLLALAMPVSLSWAAPPEDADPTGSSAGKTARAAVLPLQVEGELAPADATKLLDELVGGLRRGSFDVVSPDEVVSAASEAKSCGTADCAKKVANKTNATHVVRATVKVADRDYALTVELVDGANGKTLATTKDGCEICGVADAGQLMTAAAATLRTKLDALAGGPAQMVLSSTPAGAVVTIDGEVVGLTPLTMEVIPGKHVVRVRKEGFIAVDREVTFVEGVTESVSVDLEKLPSKLPGRTWGYVSLGVGVAALGGGIALTFLHDQPDRRDCSAGAGTKDADGDCKFLYDTKWAGLGTAVGGAVLVTLGAAILANAGKREGGKQKGSKGKKGGKANARFGFGPGSVVVMGRF